MAGAWIRSVEPTEWQDLITGCIARDDSAWATLFDRVFRPLRRYFRHHLHNDMDAGDLAQNVLLELLKDDCRKLRIYDPSRGSFTTYLWTLASRQLLDFVRSREGKDRARWVTIDPLASALCCEVEFEKATSRGLWDAISRLAVEDQSILCLWATGFNTAELGTCFGISDGGAASRVSRAKRRLREHLDGMDCGPGLAPVLPW